MFLMLYLYLLDICAFTLPPKTTKTSAASARRIVLNEKQFLVKRKKGFEGEEKEKKEKKDSMIKFVIWNVLVRYCSSNN